MLLASSACLGTGATTSETARILPEFPMPTVAAMQAVASLNHAEVNAWIVQLSKLCLKLHNPECEANAR